MKSIVTVLMLTLFSITCMAINAPRKIIFKNQTPVPITIIYEYSKVLGKAPGDKKYVYLSNCEYSDVLNMKWDLYNKLSSSTYTIERTHLNKNSNYKLKILQKKSSELEYFEPKPNKYYKSIRDEIEFNIPYYQGLPEEKCKIVFHYKDIDYKLYFEKIEIGNSNRFHCIKYSYDKNNRTLNIKLFPRTKALHEFNY